MKRKPDLSYEDHFQLRKQLVGCKFISPVSVYRGKVVQVIQVSKDGKNVSIVPPEALDNCTTTDYNGVVNYHYPSLPRVNVSMGTAKKAIAEYETVSH